MPKGMYFHKKVPEKTKQKMRLAHLGKKYIMTKDGIENIILARKKPVSKQAREKMRIAKLGKKPSIETRKKMSEAGKGAKCHFWKGGITSINIKIRMSFEYKLWRESVFRRDNYTCIWCGQRGGRLNADHIKPFAFFPELRFAIDNGRTLCIDCHKKTDSYLNRWNKNKKI